MNIPEQHIGLFDAYFNNTLSEKEVKEFDARLVYESEFKEQFETYKQVVKGIKPHFRNELKNKLKQLDEALDKKTKVVPITKNNKLKQLYLAIGSVAAILIIGIVLHFSTQNSTSNLVAQYWPTEEGLPVKMSTKGKFDAAMNAFKQAQWQKAEMLLEQIDSDTSDYFIGVINFEQKEYKNAVVSFESVPENSTWHQETEFRLALVYLQMGEFEEAKAILQTIKNSHSTYQKQAAKIYQNL